MNDSTYDSTYRLYFFYLLISLILKTIRNYYSFIIILCLTLMVLIF